VKGRISELKRQGGAERAVNGKLCMANGVELRRGEEVGHEIACITSGSMTLRQQSGGEEHQLGGIPGLPGGFRPSCLSCCRQTPSTCHCGVHSIAFDCIVMMVMRTKIIDLISSYRDEMW
jgi:hypothetical protein